MPSAPTPQPPNCWQCRHFAISWDPHLPYLCRAIGFKSAITPALEVWRADGQACRSFTARAKSPTDERAPHRPTAEPTPTPRLVSGEWLA